MSCISTDLCYEGIKKNIKETCDNQIFSGVESAGIVINKSDIESFTRDANNGRLITNITLKPGKHAYTFINERNNPFTGTHTDLVIGDYGNTFTRTVAGYVPLDGAEVSKSIIDPFAHGKFVVIMENQWEHKDSDGKQDNKFQIYGLEKGLKAASMVQTKYENRDSWILEMTEEEVPNSGLFLRVESADSEVDITGTQLDAGVIGEVSYDYYVFKDGSSVNLDVKVTDAQFDSLTDPTKVTYSGIYNHDGKDHVVRGEFNMSYTTSPTRALTEGDVVVYDFDESGKPKIGFNDEIFSDFTVLSWSMIENGEETTCEFLNGLLG